MVTVTGDGKVRFSKAAKKVGIAGAVIDAELLAPVVERVGNSRLQLTQLPSGKRGIQDSRERRLTSRQYGGRGSPSGAGLTRCRRCSAAAARAAASLLPQVRGSACPC